MGNKMVRTLKILSIYENSSKKIKYLKMQGMFVAIEVFNPHFAGISLFHRILILISHTCRRSLLKKFCVVPDFPSIVIAFGPKCCTHLFRNYWGNPLWKKEIVDLLPPGENPRPFGKKLTTKSLRKSSELIKITAMHMVAYLISVSQSYFGEMWGL